MAKSLGPVVAILSANTDGFSSEMRKAAIQAENSASKIRAAFKKGGAAGAMEAAQNQTDQLLRKYERDAQRWVKSKGPQAAESSTTDKAVELGLALKAIDTSFKLATVGAKLVSGEFKNVGDAASEAMKAVPVLGQSLSTMFDWARGTDLRKDLEARQKQESQLAYRAGAERASALKGIGAGITGAGDEVRLLGAKQGIERDLLKVTIDEQAKLNALTEKYGDAARQSGSVAKELDKARAAEVARFAAIRAEVIRQDEKARGDALRGVSADIEVLRTKQTYGAQAAESRRIELDYAEKIREANDKGNDALARQLATLRDMTLAESKKEAATKRAELEDRLLSASGKSAEVIRRRYDREITKASDADKPLLAAIRDAEIRNAKTGGVSQVSSKALTAVGSGSQTLKVQGVSETNKILQEILRATKEKQIARVS